MAAHNPEYYPAFVSESTFAAVSLPFRYGKLALGQQVQIVPSHGCTTIPLYDKYILIKDNRAVDTAELISGSAAY